MGRKTWDSIPYQFRPLYHRLNLVITSSVIRNRIDLLNEVGFVNSKETVLGFYNKSLREKNINLFVIGGLSIYEMFMPETDEIYLSQLSESYLCDPIYPFFFVIIA